MSATVLVKAGKRYYRVHVNPIRSMTDDDLEKYSFLMKEYARASKKGRLTLMIRLERRIRKMESGKRS